MKRIITIFTCMLLVTLLTIPAFAATSITLNASKTTVNTGDTITVSVAAAADNCSLGGIEVTYNSKVLTLTSGDCTLDKADIKYFDAKSGDGGFAFETATKLTGTIFKLTFQVKEDAAPGSSTISVKFKNGKDSASRSIDIKVACVHKYDNNCDTTCNVCGDTREAKHDWDSGKVTKKATCSAAGEKLYTCTTCKKTKTETVKKLSHSYDNDCDSECNNCGHERDIDHEFTQLYDETHHWMKCKVCGTIKNKTKHNTSSNYSTTTKAHGYKCKDCGAMTQEKKHVFENECDPSCSVCGYTRNISHSYSTKWTYDETKHWHECEVCKDQLEAIPHKPGPEATEESDQICTECGYVIAPAQKHEHTMAGDWLNDSIGHWYRCECGEQSKPDVHEWGEVTQKGDNMVSACVECGYERIEGPAPTEPTEPSETEPEVTDPTRPSGTPIIRPTPSDDQGFEMPWKQIALWSILVAVISIGVNALLIWLMIRRSEYEYEDDE